MKSKIRSQPRIKGVRRIPVGSSLLPEIEKALTDTARKYRVSRSWVQAVINAKFFGIRTQVDYD